MKLGQSETDPATKKLGLTRSTLLGLYRAGAGYTGGRWPQASTTRGMQPMVPGVRA